MRRYPIPIAIFDLLVELVVLDTEFVHIAETILHRLPYAPQAVLDIETEI